MPIQIIYDARSDISNVVSVEYLNEKRKTKQIGSIRCYDRPIYKKGNKDLSAWEEPDIEKADALTTIAIQELFRFHEVVLNRRYEFLSNGTTYKLNEEDKAKIDREIKRLTLNWENALKKAFDLKLSVGTKDILERLKPILH